MQTVPCGHCLGCRSDQARGWQIRIGHEAHMAPSTFMLTLTYEEVPENGSLDPEDLRLFWRRLRRRYEDVTYYACGEYGEENLRPHYHAIVFGPDFFDRYCVTYRNGAPVWTSRILDNAWKLGRHEITGVNAAAARYVANYVQKKVRQRDNPDWYTRVCPKTGELVQVCGEFSRMSRRPAVGKRWIEKYWSDVYPRDYVLNEGVKVKPPRYYDKWLDDHYPQLMMEVREKRYAEAEEIGAEKLAAMEKIHQSRMKLFARRNRV